MKNETRLILLPLLLAPLLYGVQAQATIYKCENKKKEVYYNDKPCPVSDKETEIRPVKDPIGGYIPTEVTKDAEGVTSKGVVVGKTINRILRDNQKHQSKSSELKKEDGKVSGNTVSSSNSHAKDSASANGANNVSSPDLNKEKNQESGDYSPVMNVPIMEGY